MPVAPRTSTVPSVPVSSWRWRSGSHEDIPAATRSGAVPAGTDSCMDAGTAARSAKVPCGGRTKPV